MRKIALVLCFAFIMLSAAMAADTVKVEISDEVIRQIDSHFFGAGFSYYSSANRIVVDTPAMVDVVKECGINTMRFPHGTSALWYYWDAVGNSYRPEHHRKTDPITYHEFVKTCRKMDCEPLLQVNTYRFIMRKGNERFEGAVAAPSLLQAADYAAKWVKECKDKNYNVRYWEIGNEDWVYWSGRQYANIVNAYAAKMKEADPGIKIVITGFPLTAIADFYCTNTDGEFWMRDLIKYVDKDVVDVLSMHIYYGSLIPGKERTREERVAATIAQAVWDKQIKDINNLLKEYNLDWQVWVTEWNVWEGNEKVVEKIEVNHDLGQALTSADWIGTMLEDNVEKMYFHELNEHPAFLMIASGYWTTPDKPLIMAEGLASQAFSREFGENMLKVKTSNNDNSLTGEFRNFIRQPKDLSREWVETYQYPAVGAYAATRSDDKTLRVVLTNRNLEASSFVDIQLGNKKIDASRQIEMRVLGEGLPLTANNMKNPKEVVWSSKNISQSDLANIELGKHSVNLLIVPLQ